MKKTIYIILAIMCAIEVQAQQKPRTILGFSFAPTDAQYQYIEKLTGKDNPTICLLPTAVGDEARVIVNWLELGQRLKFNATYCKTFVSSNINKTTYEELLLNADAIFVWGGNTLNMLAIWKVQGIDSILRKAYEKGIVLSGGSAGAICWFQQCITDSRPVNLSLINGLGWLKGSNCTHLDKETARLPAIKTFNSSGELMNGFAIEDGTAVLFQNEQFIKAITTGTDKKVWRFFKQQNRTVFEEVNAEIVK